MIGRGCGRGPTSGRKAWQRVNKKLKTVPRSVNGLPTGEARWLTSVRLAPVWSAVAGPDAADPTS